jgi:hypothetical protein
MAFPMTSLTRRSLVTGLISLVAAPAIVRAGSLMPVRQMLDAEDRWPIMIVHRNAYESMIEQQRAEYAEALFGWAGNITSGTMLIYGRPDEDPAALPLS